MHERRVAKGCAYNIHPSASQLRASYKVLGLRYSLLYLSIMRSSDRPRMSGRLAILDRCYLASSRAVGQEMNGNASDNF